MKLYSCFVKFGSQCRHDGPSTVVAVDQFTSEILDDDLRLKTLLKAISTDFVGFRFRGAQLRRGSLGLGLEAFARRSAIVI